MTRSSLALSELDTRLGCRPGEMRMRMTRMSTTKTMKSSHDPYLDYCDRWGEFEKEKRKLHPMDAKEYEERVRELAQKWRV